MKALIRCWQKTTLEGSGYENSQRLEGHEKIYFAISHLFGLGFNVALIQQTNEDAGWDMTILVSDVVELDAEFKKRVMAGETDG